MVFNHVESRFESSLQSRSPRILTKIHGCKPRSIIIIEVVTDFFAPFRLIQARGEKNVLIGLRPVAIRVRPGDAIVPSHSSRTGRSVQVSGRGRSVFSFTGIEDALDAIGKAVEKAGYKLGEDIFFALDAASSEFYDAESNAYVFKNGRRNHR
jgi:hypothetical protein